MKTLYFNTLLGKIDIIITDFDNVLYQDNYECQKQSEFLVYRIEESLKKTSLKYNDIDFFSTLRGVGNFTNIKTNLAVIKALITTATEKQTFIISDIFEIISFNEKYDFMAYKVNQNKFYVEDINKKIQITKDIVDLKGKVLTEFTNEKWLQFVRHKIEENKNNKTLDKIIGNIEPLYIENANITIKQNS
jgi:tRNA A37 threonylcarbamoyladenosine modification protein TsaB